MAYYTHSHKFSSSPYPKFSTAKPHKSHWVAWKKPLCEFIKFNFDGSKTSQRATGGFIIRNWEGRFIQALAFNLGTTSILLVEAKTMRNGIQVAVRAGFPTLFVEGDNKIIIQAMKSQVHAPWQIQTPLQDIQTDLQSVHWSLSSTFLVKKILPPID